MSLRGKPSTAHTFHLKTGQCIYCDMYKSNVEALSHECTPQREALEDARMAKLKGLEKEANDHGE